MDRPVCPGCGKRDQDTPSGLCSVCVVDRAASNYSEVDRARTQARIREWQASTSRADAWSVMRQQRRRQIEAVRPTRPAASLDPWDLAISAIAVARRLYKTLDATDGIRARFEGRSARTDLEDIIEAIRRLAWGPADGESWAPKTSRARRQIPGQMTLFDVLEAVIAA